MSRKLRSFEDLTWYNPLKDANPKPDLSDMIWPDDPRGPSWEKAITIMKRFYCAEREQGQEDVNALQRYLNDPVKYMIVWGDVGIGKTWFMRYQLLAGESSMAAKGYYAGAVDILSGRDAEYAVYKQLKHALELYFEHFCGGTAEAIRKYLIFDIAKLYGKPESELDESELNDVQIALTECLALRNDPSQESTTEYVRRLLEALQHLDRDEPLILLVDNIDKTHDEEQERLVKLAARLLRHPNIRLIIPLRKSSQLLADRFSVLKQFSYEEITLHPVVLREMLRLRFQWSRDGSSLTGSPKVQNLQNGTFYTFPQVFSTLFGRDEKSVSEAGKLLLTIAASNAREALVLAERLLYSDQLKGLGNIGRPEYAVAALMLNDASQPHPTSCVINLFNNEEPDLPGNALIRFRALEYFWKASHANTSAIRVQRYFLRLGYELDRVKQVIELLLMTQLLVSTRGLSPDDVRGMAFNDIGRLEITPSGHELRILLNRIWYWASVKRDIYLPKSKIGHNPDGSEYCTHTDLIAWLQQKEREEGRAIEESNRKHGAMKLDWGLTRPHRLAMQALKPRQEDKEE